MSRIITFYSYKGGVGRTFALANIAVLMAKQGKRVLMIDWDLEAPGLSHYFRRYLPVGPAGQGLIHLLGQASADLAADWRPYVRPVNISDSIHLSLISSGDGLPNYSEHVQRFSWQRFFEESHGGQVLEQWRDDWKNDFDFTLIDSRTGITDSGGVCTVMLPDILVLAFGTSHQSFDCALQVAFAVQKSRSELAIHRPPVAVLPIPGRFDGRDEVDDARLWLDRFAEGLKPFYDDWLPSRFSARQVLEVTKVPYVAKYSFGEPIAVLTAGVTDPELPGYYLANNARLLMTAFADAPQMLASEGAVSIVSELRSYLTSLSPSDDEVIRLLTLLERTMGPSAEFLDLLAASAEALSRRSQFAVSRLLGFARAVVNGYPDAGDPTWLGPLNKLATIFRSTGESLVAESLCRRALQLAEKHGVNGGLDLLNTLDTLAAMAQESGGYTEAEALLRRVQIVAEATFGAKDQAVAKAINNLAMFLKNANRLDEAEEMYHRAIGILEGTPGSDRSATATTLNNLGLLLLQANRLSEAETTLRRALSLLGTSQEKENAIVSTSLLNLATLLKETGRLQEAESLLREAVSIDEATLGKDHPRLASSLNNLALLLEQTNRTQEAEPVLRRVLATFENLYGLDHPSVAIAHTNLASLLHTTNRLSEAETHYRRALQTLERSFGPEHPQVASSLSNLALLLGDTGRTAEARPMIRRAIEIDRRSFGTSHPRYAIRLNNLALILMAEGQSAEAEKLLREALQVLERSYGTMHPEVGATFNNLGGVLRAQNCLEQAEHMFRQALLVHEHIYGPEHPDVALDLNNLAQVLRDLGSLDEAEKFSRRHVAILRTFEQRSGHEHQHMQQALRNYASILQQMNIPADERERRIAELMVSPPDAATGSADS